MQADRHKGPLKKPKIIPSNSYVHPVHFYFLDLSTLLALPAFEVVSFFTPATRFSFRLPLLPVLFTLPPPPPPPPPLFSPLFFSESAAAVAFALA